jgi:tetratricopeptide (TPR) repeat protein
MTIRSLLISKKTAQYLVLVLPLLIGMAFHQKIRSTYTAITKQQQTPLATLLEQGQDLYKKDAADKAIQLYTRALKTDAGILTALIDYGIALASQEKYAQAVPFFQTAVTIEPRNPVTQVQTGMCLAHVQRHEEALEHFQKALALSPNSCEAHLQMSKSLVALKKLDAALEHAQKAVHQEPKHILARMNLGFVYNERGELEKAIEQYKTVLTINPHFASALYNTGYSLKIAGHMQEAIPYLEKAIAARPNHVDSHIALSHVYWSLGDFAHAWKEYEWRWKMFPQDPRPLTIPAWDGTADLHDKKILLYTEQGMGDTLQFIRFAKNIKQRGAHVTCKIQKPLMKLLSTYPYVDTFVTEYPADLSKFDYQAPLLSMPGLLKITPQTLPTEMPYLTVDKNLVEFWRQKISGDKKFKIGLCWHVDPIHEKDKSPISRRSVPVDQFAQVINSNSVTVYSLQKINGVDQLKNLPADFNFSMATFDPHFDEVHGRFMDSAALIANLDLIITVDTSIAHLAAGLGKETWVLLPVSPDCRFSLGTCSMPWYPTMRLFRQKKAFDWSGALQEVKVALRKKVSAFEQAHKFNS